MKYDRPNIDDWQEDDRRRNCLAWDLEYIRQMYNAFLGKWFQPVPDVPPVVGHPHHLFIKEAFGATLDIGCGNGSLLLSLLKYHNIENGVGIDISDLMVENSKQSAENVGVTNVEFIQSSLEGFESEKLFDSIIAYDVLEHFWSVTEAMQKIVSLLKPDGVFIGTTPYDRCCDGTEHRVHLHYFKEDDLIKLFQPFFASVRVICKTITESEDRLYFWCQNDKS